MLATSVAAPYSRAHNLTLAGLALAQTVVFLVPMIVLGQAIGWPGSLRLPPADVFISSFRWP